jgi:uncharacterized RDD family membrane protein YckC
VTEPNPNFDINDAPENESWKNEVASRLDTYRSRSNRKLSGQFSMRFNFDGDPAPPRQQVCLPDLPPSPELPEVEPEPSLLVEAETPQAESDVLSVGESIDIPRAYTPPPPEPLRPSVPFKRKVVMEANVIEFPRLFPPDPQPPYAVAEPILPTMPRILDAPEIGQPLLETPILDGMRLDHLERAPNPDLELPREAASIAMRVYSAMADALVVLAASGIFAIIASRMLADVEWTKPLLGASLAVPALLWALYEFLFIVYAGRTPGMVVTHLAFSTFQSGITSRRQRRRRVLGIALSCSSLMLGFVWALFDEDALCWHDRISRTCLIRVKPGI